MAKKEVKSLIALELENFEKKINQFQNYLNEFNISTIDEDKKRHDEITAQIRIMDALPKWLLELERMRIKDVEEKEKVVVKGGNELSGLMQEKITT